jgi:urease accessory protein
MKTLVSGLLLLFLASPVSAHTGSDSTQGFFDGFIHPFQGIDHLLVIFAIGLWACLLAGKMVWALPITFLVMMGTGAGLYFTGFTLHAAGQVALLSVLVLGLVLGLNLRIRIAGAIVLVAMIAICHGYVHAAEMAVGANKISYALGFLLATVHLQGMDLAAGLLGSKMVNIVRICLSLTCSTVFVALLAG